MTIPTSEFKLFSGDSAWDAFRAWLAQEKFSQIITLVDTNTLVHCLPYLQQQVEEKIHPLVIPASESEKKLDTAAYLWRAMMANKVDRHALLINLGGGVVTDMGGFVASTFKRGISFAHIPTTLLGMVDAAIGGKTGIDLDYSKNIVGTFAPADTLVIDPAFLETLPLEDKRSGFAEMLKHGLVQDVSLWSDLSGMPGIDTVDIDMILRAGAIKRCIVDQDPHEKGIRKILNFGHTLGHAIESWALQSSMAIRHGEAVAAGMLLESWLSLTHNGLSWEDWTDIRRTIQRFFPPLDFRTVDPEGCLPYIFQDKKNRAGTIRCVMLRRPGQAEWDIEVTAEQVRTALSIYPTLF